MKGQCVFTSEDLLCTGYFVIFLQMDHISLIQKPIGVPNMISIKDVSTFYFKANSLILNTLRVLYKWDHRAFKYCYICRNSAFQLVSSRLRTIFNGNCYCFLLYPTATAPNTYAVSCTTKILQRMPLKKTNLAGRGMVLQSRV